MLGDRKPNVINLGKAPPRVLGVSRVADNQRAMLVLLDREPTDDELRRMHEALRPKRPLFG